MTAWMTTWRRAPSPPSAVWFRTPTWTRPQTPISPTQSPCSPIRLRMTSSTTASARLLLLPPMTPSLLALMRALKPGAASGVPTCPASRVRPSLLRRSRSSFLSSARASLIDCVSTSLASQGSTILCLSAVWGQRLTTARRDNVTYYRCLRLSCPQRTCRERTHSQRGFRAGRGAVTHGCC